MCHQNAYHNIRGYVALALFEDYFAILHICSQKKSAWHDATFTQVLLEEELELYIVVT